MLLWQNDTELEYPVPHIGLVAEACTVKHLRLAAGSSWTASRLHTGPLCTHANSQHGSLMLLQTV